MVPAGPGCLLPVGTGALGVCSGDQWGVVFGGSPRRRPLAGLVGRIASRADDHKICTRHSPSGHEYSKDDIGPDAFQAINRAAAKYGGLTPEDFHLPRLRYAYNTQYNDEIVEDTYHWMNGWGLISDAACAADLVDNRLSEAAAN